MSKSILTKSFQTLSNNTQTSQKDGIFGIMPLAVGVNEITLIGPKIPKGTCIVLTKTSDSDGQHLPAHTFKPKNKHLTFNLKVERTKFGMNAGAWYHNDSGEQALIGCDYLSISNKDGSKEHRMVGAPRTRSTSAETTE